MNLTNTNPTKPASWIQDPPPQQRWCQCCDTTKRRNKWGRNRNIFASANCAERPAFFRFSISAGWNVTRVYCSSCRCRILKLIWYIKGCFFGMSTSQTFSIKPFFSFNDKITFEHNWWAAKLSSVTRLERCSNVLLRPRHGLFILCAEGVTLRNKNRSMFSAADPRICTAGFATQQPAAELWSPHEHLFSLVCLEALLLSLTCVNFRSHSPEGNHRGSFPTALWTVSFPPSSSSSLSLC